MALFIVRLDGAHPLRPPIVYTNAAFSALTGYSKEEIRTGKYPRIVGPRTERDLIEAQARRVARGEHVTTEVMLYHRDGRSFWARVHAHPIDSFGRHGVLIVEDVTERRDREKRLALLEEAVEQASDFVIVTDTRTHDAGGPLFVYVNRSFFEATGYSSDELIGMPYTTIYSSNNDASLMQAVREAIEAGQPNYREMLAVRKDGTEFWIEFVAKPFNMSGEKFRLSIGRDITLRKRAFNQIALLFSAIEQSPHRVVLYEPDESGNLVASYENGPASEAGNYRLLRMWERGADATQTLRTRLLAGETVQEVYSDDLEGAPTLFEIVMRGVRNGNQLGAVLTTERVLAQGIKQTYESRVITFANLMPALTSATTTQEVLDVLQTILRDTFGAVLTEIGTTISGVRISPGSGTAYFAIGGRSYSAKWRGAMEDSSLTAVRFCIEAAIERDKAARAAPG